MKFIQIKIKILNSVDGTIKCWFNEHLVEIDIKDEQKSLENIRFTFGGKTDINGEDAADAVKGDIKNVRIEEGPLFGVWSDWSSCSVTCGGGERSRTRPCSSGCSIIDDDDDDDDRTETEVCNQSECNLKFKNSIRPVNRNRLHSSVL